MRFNKKFYIKLMREAVILGLMLMAVHFYQTRSVPNIAPELKASLMSGQMFDLAKISEPTVIYFWGSWCPICSITSPIVNDISKQYPVVSIAYVSGDEQQIKRYMHKEQLTFAVINDQYGYISQHWNVEATPMFFIINSKGEIASATSGVTSSWGLKLRLWLAEFI